MTVYENQLDPVQKDISVISFFFFFPLLNLGINLGLHNFSSCRNSSSILVVINEISVVFARGNRINRRIISDVFYALTPKQTCCFHNLGIKEKAKYYFHNYTQKEMFASLLLEVQIVA